MSALPDYFPFREPTGPLTWSEAGEVRAAVQAALSFHQVQCPGPTRHACQLCRQLESALVLLGGAR